MPDIDQLLEDLQQAGLGHWSAPLEPLLRRRIGDGAHGDFSKWRAVMDALPVIRDTTTKLDVPAVTAESASLDSEQRRKIRELLLQLKPWRKGPFRVYGIEIDAEWRSDLKWDRVARAISSLDGRRVLDVGCGNGYYACRSVGAGARLVVGIDPTVLYLMQFDALNHFLAVPSIHLLPLRLNELPDPRSYFDTTFSMGVLYHQRNAPEHLAQLHATLRPGGELVLETLVFPGDEMLVYEPEDRYARMRNVWQLPTAAALNASLLEAGFRDPRLADIAVTTVEEQRTTEWMPFESLKEALDQNDPSRTVEGLPAPARAIVICEKP